MSAEELTLTLILKFPYYLHSHIYSLKRKITDKKNSRSSFIALVVIKDNKITLEAMFSSDKNFIKEEQERKRKMRDIKI